MTGKRVDLDEAVGGETGTVGLDLPALDDALDRLEAQSPHMAKIVELRFFGGLARAEVAEIMGVSEPTITRQWQSGQGGSCFLLARGRIALGAPRTRWESCSSGHVRSSESSVTCRPKDNAPAWLELEQSSPNLHAQVERLLKEDDDADPRLEGCALDFVTHGGPNEPMSTDLRARLARIAARVRPLERLAYRRKIAQGGMGVIYELWDEDLERRVAMKALAAGPHDLGPGGTPPATKLERFLNEAKIIGKLDHPGIVPVHDLGIDQEGQPYFTMKLVEGSTLDVGFALASSEREGWTEARALGAILKVCEAVAYAHSKNVIHRDLKPSNIMVGRFGEVFVMDWGVARVLGQPDPRGVRPREHSIADRAPVRTLDGAVIGTPFYMSPEQACGDTEDIDTRTDVYAIGATLYKLLAGIPPFGDRSNSDSPHTVLAWVRAGPPHRELVTWYPPRLPN